MKNYDWIVIGGGITGAALGYELTQKGLSVLLLEQTADPQNATKYSYGGLAYWSGTSPLTQQLSQEGIQLHRQLSAELEADTEFREVDLVLTINAEDDPETIRQNYDSFAISPQLLDVKEACQLEPLLNPHAISGVLRLPHGHINAHQTTQAYLQAMQRQGGELKRDRVTELLQNGTSIQGVKTPTHTYHAANTVVCAGGLSRFLLKSVGIDIPLYFTHAEVIVTPPIDNIRLRTLVMPAQMQRFDLEAKASQPHLDSLWDEPNHEPAPSILDPGAVQFRDGSICLGQLTRVLTNPHGEVNAVASEAKIRSEVGEILPTLGNLPGSWHSCLVAFARNPLPTIGSVHSLAGLHVFSGFTSTLLFAPPLAKHFANWAVGEEDEILQQLSN